MSTNERDEQKESGAEVAADRRRLLKAAASAAPLVATLQSGAVFANGSAFNCLVKNSEENPDLVRASRDNWVRQEVIRYRFAIDSDPNDPTDWKYDIDEIHGTSSGGTTVKGPYYEQNDADGDGKGSTWENTNDWPVASQETVFVLVYYDANSDNTDAVRQGAFPKFMDWDGTMRSGLGGTCLCSISPNEPICQ